MTVIIYLFLIKFDFIYPQLFSTNHNMMEASKNMAQKELRKNRKAQRNLSDKDDCESMRKLERLIVEENKMIQNIEHDKQRRAVRLQNSKEKNLLESMTFEEMCEYLKSKDGDTDYKIKNHIPNTREARIHRKRVIEGINEYKMNQYFTEQIEMRSKLKAFLESIESED